MRTATNPATRTAETARAMTAAVEAAGATSQAAAMRVANTARTAAQQAKADVTIHATLNSPRPSATGRPPRLTAAEQANAALTTRTAQAEAAAALLAARVLALETQTRRLPYTGRHTGTASVLIAIGATRDVTLDVGRALPTTNAADYIVTAVGTGALARQLLTATIVNPTTIRATIPAVVTLGQAFGIDVTVTPRA